MKPIIILLLSFLLSSPIFSQSDEEYSKINQKLLREHGGFSRDSRKKTPREYLAGDKRLLNIFEKAKTFDSRYFKDDYRPSYEKYRELVAKEDSLVTNYYHWLGKYQKKFSGSKISVWGKFCSVVFKRGDYEKKKAIATAQELSEFYDAALIPVLNSALIDFGKFWFKEKCRCTEQGVIWKTTVDY